MKVDQKNSIQSVKVNYPLSVRIKRSWFYRVMLKPLVVLLVVLLLVLLSRAVLGWRERVASNQCNGKDSSPIYRDAALVLNPASKQELQKVVDRIQLMDGHEKDASCLAVLVHYYLSTDNNKEAMAYMDKLNLVAKGDNFNESLGPLMDDKDVLAQKVEFLRLRSEQQDKNTVGY